MLYPFLVGSRYRRRDVYRIIGISEDTQGGNWDTGYARHLDDYFVFTNISTPGRTGHDYGNRWEGEALRWYAKTGTRLENPSIQRLIASDMLVYLFYRTDSGDPYFTFAGLATAAEVLDVSPVEVLWTFSPVPFTEQVAEEVSAPGTFLEGARTQVWVNRYERSPEARKKCLEHHGTRCSVCSFSFEERYGPRGRGFIHVHHLVPLSDVGAEYALDPVADLRPVCPNCHAMLHRGPRLLRIEELQAELLPPSR